MSKESYQNEVTVNIRQVLEGKAEPIRKNSFWNEYKTKFGALPDLKSLPDRVTKRSELFQYCNDFCDIQTLDDGFEYLVLKSVRKKAKAKRRKDKENEENHTVVAENRSTPVIKQKEKDTDIQSKLKALRIQSTGAYSKLSGKQYETRVKDNSDSFDLQLDFPKIGEESGQGDTMGKHDRNTRWDTTYHPYANQQQTPPTVPQQAYMAMPAGMGIQAPPSFCDQFYNSASNVTPQAAAQTPTQSQHPQTPTQSQRRQESHTPVQQTKPSYSSRYTDQTSTSRRESGPSRDYRTPMSDQGRYGARSDTPSRGSHHRGGYAKVYASKEQLNLVAKEAISRLAEAKEFVSVERVEKLLFQHFNVNSLSDLNVYNIEHIETVRELMRAHGKVNAYIQAFMRARSVSTMHELQSDLENLCCKQGEDFESLQVGPLQSQPLVYDFFKFPEKSPIPSITTCDVLDMLRDWLSDNNLWSSRDLDLEKFMEYMQEQRGLDTPYELGVRIRSLILLIQVLKRSQAECSRTVKDILKRQKDRFKDDITVAFQTLTRALLDKEPGTACAVRQEYMKKNSSVAVVEMLEKVKLFYDTLQALSGGHSATLLTKGERRHARLLADVLAQFSRLLVSDPIQSTIFTLAVCSSEQELQEQLWERLVTHFQPRFPTENKRRHVVFDSDGEEIEVIDDDAVDDDEGGRGGSRQQSQPKPSRAAVEEKVHKYLERCVMSGALTLDILHRIEAKILEDFEFQHFTGLGHGSFLQCLTSIQRVKQLLEESGGMTVGGAQQAGGKGGESVYHTTQHHLLDFIRQAAITDPNQTGLLEDAICSHYHVADVKNLGQGSTQHLLALSARQRHAKEPSVVYEHAMSAKARGLSVRGERQVGMLGSQTREKALACLQSCPLLEDLEEWSHWDLVFKPEFGDLKEFIQRFGKLHNSNITENNTKYTMTTHIVAMETKPGTLLKLTADTSPAKFEEAVSAGDVQDTCGHLLSLLAINKGIDNLPMPLLGNHVKTALIRMQAEQEAAVDNDDGLQANRISRVCQFVVECLTLLPFAACQAVTNKVFLEPLSQVVGSAKSKDLLLQAASTNQQKGRLQILGCALGINEWVKTFEKRLKPPAHCLEKHEVPMEFAEFGKETVLVADDDTEESDEESQDVVDLLTDDDDDEDEPLSQEEEEEIVGEPTKIDDVIEGDAKINQSSDEAEKEASAADANESNENTENADTVVEGRKENTDKVVDKTEIAIPERVKVDAISKYGPTVDPHFLLIEQIRRNKFGVNFEMTDEFRALFESQSEMMGRGLERLSKDLYSKDTHFVLELIQNADDNDYPGLQADGLTVSRDAPAPSVLFCVERDRIAVYNNETGFKEKNIRAICDVGRSTKGKHKFGYIGQKGIGFKSVFRVTDRPEIRSNGFHICFDVNSGPMGYIMPHWIGKMPKEIKKDKEIKEKEVDQDGDEESEKDETVEDNERSGENNTDSEEDSVEMEEDIEEEKSEWTTHITLPLKQSVREQGQMRSLAARFNDVHPSLLLFLHRLRHLTVLNKVEDYTQEIKRCDLPNDVVEISHSTGTDRWLVVKQMLDASKISEQAKSGVEVESTEIALAFQLMDKAQRDTQVLPQKQPVFAFLPLRSYGFRFVIQGDFDVPSSREDVERDSVWNQWLTGHVPELFVNALQHFKSQPGVSEVDAVCMFLQYLPLEDEIIDFFRPIATKILHQIRAKPCLPAQPGKNKAIQWKMPSKLVVCKDSLVRDIVKSELLQQQLSLDYLHPGVMNRLNSSLISTLGVQTLTTQHLLDLGKTTIAQLVDDQTSGPEAYTKKLEFLAKWLTCLFRSIDEIQPDEATMTQLKQLAIMPLADGDMVKLTEKTVFFPITDERKGNKKQRTNQLMRRLAEDVNTIEPGLFTCLDDVANSQVHKLLDMLGVKVMTPHEVINHHIMPVLKSDLKTQKSREMLFAYLVYIKEELDNQPDLVDREELKKYAIVLTNHGPRNPASHPVHFTTAFGNQIDLPRTLPGYDWVLVDACYLQGCGQYAIQGWYNFLAMLGVLDFLSIQQTTTTISRDELDNTPWASEKDLLPKQDKYTVADSVSDELMVLLTENKHQESYFSQMQSLMRLIEVNFDAMYKQHTVARIMTVEDHPLKDVESTFAKFLKSWPWLPASVIKLSPNSGQLVQKKDTRIASDLYVQQKEITDLLHVHVPYLDCPISTSSSFADFLGVQKKVTIATVKDSLIKWCTKVSRDEDDIADTDNTEVEFLTSMGHIKRVYGYLQQNLPPKEFQDLVVMHPVIFYADKVPPNSTIDIGGTFLSSKQVWWRDSSTLFSKYQAQITTLRFSELNKRVLCQLYPEPEFREMFVRQGRVPLNPSYQEYARLLMEIPAVVPIVNNALQDVLRLYEILGKQILLTDDGTSQPENNVKIHISVLKPILKGCSVIPTRNERWVALEDKPMIGDDRQMEKMWKDKPGVHLVNFGEKIRFAKGNKDTLDVITALLKHLGVTTLSEMVEMTQTTEMYEPCPQLQFYVHRVVPYIQKFLFLEYSDVYAGLLDKQIKTKLAVLQFAQVSKLELVYNIKGLENGETVVKSERCRLINEQEFYVLKDLVRSFSDINRELARFFSLGNASCAISLRDYLTELFPLVEDEDNMELQRFLDDKDINQLPNSEQPWEVPKPANWPPPPPEPEPQPFPMAFGNFMPGYGEGPEPAVMETIREAGDVKREPSAGVRAWPPQAPKGFVSNKPPEERKHQSSWPPPAPPKHSNYKELPEGMRLPPRLQEQSDREGVKEESNADSSGDNQDQSKTQDRGHAQDRGHDGAHPPRSPGDVPRPRSPGQESVVSEGGTRRHGSSHPGASHTGAGSGHSGSHPPAPGGSATAHRHGDAPPRSHDDKLPEVESEEGATQEPVTSEREAQGGPARSVSGETHHGGAPSYSRSESQVEMEYIEEGEVQLVSVQEGWRDGDAAGHRVAKKRARMESGDWRHKDGDDGHRKPVVFYGNPIWTETNGEDKEIVYQELAHSKDIALPDIVELDENAAPPEIALWGETLVHSYLNNLQTDPESDIVEVQWVNEQEESGAPYDFVLKVRDPQGQEVIDVYIEVKSTLSDKKAFFEISSQQFRFAQETQENFHLYRVFNAGDQSRARLTKLVNVAQLLDKKQVRLCMVV